MEEYIHSKYHASFTNFSVYFIFFHRYSTKGASFLPHIHIDSNVTTICSWIAISQNISSYIFCMHSKYKINDMCVQRYTYMCPVLYAKFVVDWLDYFIMKTLVRICLLTVLSQESITTILFFLKNAIYIYDDFYVKQKFHC